MTTRDDIACALAEDFARRHPIAAAGQFETMSAADAADALSRIESHTASEIFRNLSPACLLDVLAHSSPAAARALLGALAPTRAAALVAGLEPASKEAILGSMSNAEGREIRRLMEFPPDTAGRLMEPRVAALPGDLSVADAVRRLRSTYRGQELFNIFVMDENGSLCGAIPIHEAALANPGTQLRQLAKPWVAHVSPLAPRAEVIETMERHSLASVPVVDSTRTPVGVLQLNRLMPEVGKELSADLVSITGASSEESALSGVGFAVRMRLPWLQVNLVTAFAAASVVAIFEDTIAQFTALAVLLPVVAGQSGNTGSQALAVVLRSLALREVSVRQWPKVAAKECSAGILNGVGVAIVTSTGVYLWSWSLGLTLAVGIAMILSMAVAGIAGALIPFLLTAVGLDPAQSSSIVLTTVTDVFSFFSFLSLAAAFSALL